MADSSTSGVVVPMFGRRGRAVDVEKRVTKAEVAQHFCVTTRTVERWMYPRDGRRPIPFDKPYEGAQVTFKLSECESWYRGEVA